MNLLALPAFTDNHIWMFHDGTRAIAVDPGDSAPVNSALASSNLTLAGILVTRRPVDRVGSNVATTPPTRWTRGQRAENNHLQ
ncbi:hypothetical protein [Piscinibacter sp.]|uniref:hypothetical protein n=1 Tax=Piscinibacter sp. TaxID=1903157 RepID=UPI00391FAC21